MKKNFLLTFMILFFISAVMFSLEKKTLKFDLFFEESDTDINYTFGRAGKMAFDRNSNFYVVDIRDCVVRKYDKKGKYILSFGKKGQGPGEFNYVTNIQILKDKIIIFSSRLISYFDYSGKYHQSAKSDINIASGTLYNSLLDSYLNYEIDKETKRFLLSLRKIDNALIKEIFSYPAINRIEVGQHYWFYCYDYEKIAFSVNSKGEVIYAFSEAFEIFKYSGDKSTLILKERTKSVPIPENIRKKLDVASGAVTINGKDKEIKFAPPEKYSLIQEIIIDEKDDIWVKVRTSEFNGFYKYSAGGKKLAQYVLESGYEYERRQWLVHNGYLYMKYYDDEDGLKIYRAKL